MFNIVEYAHAHLADFVGICAHGDDLLFIRASRVAAWVLWSYSMVNEQSFESLYNESLNTSDLQIERERATE